MRLLIGGVERVLDGILPILASNHEIALFTEVHERGNFPVLDSLVTYTMKPSDDNSGFSSTFGPILQRRRLHLLAQQIKKWKPDALLLCGSKANSLSNFFARETNLPTVAYLHSLYDISRIRDPPKFKNQLTKYYRMNFTPRGFDSANLSKVKMVICVSRAIESATHARFPNLKTAVVHNGVDHKQFFPTFEDENYALCVSRYSKEKNLEMLPRSLCATEYPVIIYGALINSVAPQKTDYLQSLKAYNCQNISFELHKDQKTLLTRLQRSSIFLHPSRNEAFPLSPLEAMACGKVVVAHNSGGMPESIGNAGYLLGDNENEWRTIVGELMRSESLRKELGRKALEHSKVFTWEKTASGVEEAVKNAAAR